jgi:hypothetical protein
MDANAFDRLTRSLSTPGTRRRLLDRLAIALTGTVALLAELRAGSVRAKPNKKKCDPEPRAKTCKGKCGKVKNNCKQRVRCGSCQCKPPCGACKTCDTKIGKCVADDQQVGDPCGLCKVCDDTGKCVVDVPQINAPCGDCKICNSAGACVAVANGTECGESQYSGGKIRCCNGACPDPPCGQSGYGHGPCTELADCAGVTCCSEKAVICESGGEECFCPSSDSGGPCRDDFDCSNVPTTPFCVCGTCQAGQD